MMTNENITLQQAYNRTEYPVPGNGKRTVQALQEALEQVDGETVSDHYGTGPLIESFQAKIAEYLGKPAGVFFPSGTMAQQIALRIWCDRLDLRQVAYHPLCHLEIHEQDGLKELHHIRPILLADKDRLITLEDVRGLQENIACLLLELPQREIGGQLPSFEELEAISSYCREKGIKLHLDGARLFETLPYYGKSAKEICALFDSVYVSFYKGIGGIAGAILAGDPELAEQSKVWKRRHGGDLIGLYPYILSSDYFFDKRLPKMERYYREAVELAELYNSCESIATRPAVPVTNMFHVHANVPQEKLETALIAVYGQTGIGLTARVNPVGERACAFEISIGDLYETVPKDRLRLAFELLNERLLGTL